MNDSDNTEIIIADADLPGPYVEANDASMRARQWYFLLAGANLIVLISAAVLGAVSFSSIQTQGLATLISAILLALSLALSIVLQLLSLDRTWFVGRAVAESIRTLAWRYVTRSVPFDVTNQRCRQPVLPPRVTDTFGAQTFPIRAWWKIKFELHN